MTQYRFMQKNGKYVIDIDGHAGYANHGKDIVCSAISILCYTLLQCLAEEQSQGNIADLHIDQDDGHIHAEVIPFPEAREKVGQSIQTILTGLKLLNYQYPQYVQSF